MNFQIDPLEAQGVYRVLLEAMSHPGRRCTLPEIRTPSKKQAPLFAVLCTLLDHEVTVSVVGDAGIETLEEEVFMRTRARPTAISKADYLIVNGANSGGRLLEAKRGDPEFPDEGATAIYLINPDSISREAMHSVALQGPGIPPDVKHSPEISGIDREEFARIREVNSEFPLGVDCIFLTDKGEVMCIPRSTRIVMKVIPWAM